MSIKKLFFTHMILVFLYMIYFVSLLIFCVEIKDTDYTWVIIPLIIFVLILHMIIGFKCIVNVNITCINTGYLKPIEPDLWYIFQWPTVLVCFWMVYIEYKKNEKS